MKKSIILSLLVTIFITSGYAQPAIKLEPAPVKKEIGKPIPQENACPAIVALKKEYFKKNLTLTDKEAEKFWPIFDEYIEKEHLIHKNFRGVLVKEGIKREKSDFKAEEFPSGKIIIYYEQKLKMKQELLKEEAIFFEQIKEILTAENVSAYYSLEKEFKKELTEMREKRRNTQPPVKKPVDTKPDHSPASKEKFQGTSY
ncbi:hypothetical protein LJC67_05790 [Bacteroidales bacterium OttesenSCG-928-A14]|nr:hypothetical protein [Bacteroidales bacterium OttesenSCG-928-A14]